MLDAGVRRGDKMMSARPLEARPRRLARIMPTMSAVSTFTYLCPVDFSSITCRVSSAI